jgi:hypothetical protein
MVTIVKSTNQQDKLVAISNGLSFCYICILATRGCVLGIGVNGHRIIHCSSTPVRMYKLHILGWRIKDSILNNMIQEVI